MSSALFVLAVGVAPHRGASAAPRRQRVERERSPVTIFAPSETSKVASITLAWPGTRSRREGQNPVAGDLVSQLVSAGCGSRTAVEVAAELRRIHGTISADAGDVAFVLRGEFPEEAVSAGLALLHDCFTAPQFELDRIIDARNRWVESRLTRDSSARRSALQQLVPDLEILATVDEIDSVSRRDLVAWHREHVRGRPAVVAVAGKFDERVVRQWLRRHLPAPSAQVQTSPGTRLPAVSGQLFLPSAESHSDVVVGWTIPASGPWRACAELVSLALRRVSALPASLETEVLHYRERSILLARFPCRGGQCSSALEDLRKVLTAALPITALRSQQMTRFSAPAESTADDLDTLVLSEIVGDIDPFFRDPRGAVAAVNDAAVRSLIEQALSWDQAVIVTEGPLVFSPAAQTRASGTRKRVPRRRRAR